MSKSEKKVAPQSQEKTRETLIREAMRLFGERGFDGASTRQIADAAGTNVASIAYHFGGKAGLHRACGKAIAEMLAAASGQAAPQAGSLPGTHDELMQRISVILERMAGFLFSGLQSELVVPFILREMSHPGEAFEAIYGGMLEPVHKRLCLIWASATGGDAGSDDVKLTVFSMIGQLLYFRIAARAVALRLGHESLLETDIKTIRTVIETNISARLKFPAGGDA
jgi:TetR/AcrR family transcriptional regulator, regulator of cefoperazone and chloramphenicol sensitivity